jgi:DNA invertase Pin-like site-specific DNA recombinase
MTRRGIAYLRVSTDQQAESGLGLDGQRRAIEQAAERQGITVAATFQDAAISGSKGIEDRPGLLDAVNALKRGDVLLVAKRDRLGRDVMVVALIERLVARKKARIISAAGEGTDSDDPSAFMLRGMIDLFAQYERLIIGHRTKAALRAKRAQGLRAGAIPFGHRLADDGKTLLPAEDEQAALLTIRELRQQGRTLRAVADELNRRGLRTRRGTAWRFEYVRNLLTAA